MENKHLPKYSFADAEEIEGAIVRKANEIIDSKRRDYSGDIDPYRNFRMSEALGGVSAWRGVLTRLGDKLARIRTIMEHSGRVHVADETIMDTFADAINYTRILAGLCDEELGFYRTAKNSPHTYVKVEEPVTAATWNQDVVNNTIAHTYVEKPE